MSRTLVRLPNWIGDTVMAVPTIRLLIEQEESCSVWGPPQCAVLFEHFPGIDTIFAVDDKKTPDLLQPIGEASYGQVYLLTNSYSTARTAKALGIPERIGYRRDWRGPLLTRRVSCGPWVRSLHMVDYYLHLLPRAWRESPVDRQPKLFLSQEEIRTGRETLSSLGVSPGTPVVGITPGAAFGSAKQWESEWFQETACQLAQMGCFVILFGTERDRDLGNFILARTPSERGTNLAGRSSLRELMTLISLSACLIANDSGPMHLADALGTPAVALFGSTDSNWTGPQASHHIVMQSGVPCSPCFLRECPLDRECMRSLTQESVFQAAARLVTASSTRHAM